MGLVGVARMDDRCNSVANIILVAIITIITTITTIILILNLTITIIIASAITLKANGSDSHARRSSTDLSLRLLYEISNELLIVSVFTLLDQKSVKNKLIFGTKLWVGWCVCFFSF